MKKTPNNHAAVLRESPCIARVIDYSKRLARQLSAKACKHLPSELTRTQGRAQLELHRTSPHGNCV